MNRTPLCCWCCSGLSCSFALAERRLDLPAPVHERLDGIFGDGRSPLHMDVSELRRPAATATTYVLEALHEVLEDLDAFSLQLARE